MNKNVRKLLNGGISQNVDQIPGKKMIFYFYAQLCMNVYQCSLNMSSPSLLSKCTAAYIISSQRDVEYFGKFMSFIVRYSKLVVSGNNI